MQPRSLIFNKLVSDKKATLVVEDVMFDQQNKKCVAILSVKDNEEKSAPTYVKSAHVFVYSSQSYPMKVVYVSNEFELRAEREKHAELQGIYSTRQISKPCLQIKFREIVNFSLQHDPQRNEPAYLEELNVGLQIPEKYLRKPSDDTNNSSNAKWWIGAGAFFAIGAVLIYKAVDKVGQLKHSL